MKIFYVENQPWRIKVFLFGIRIFSRKKKFKKPKHIIIPKTSNAKNTRVIYTCITGGYDNLIEHNCINLNCDYVCFTDNPDLLSKGKVGVWEIRPVKKITQDNSLNNRWHKMHPHILFPNYEDSIYIDGNIDVITEKLFNDINSVPTNSFFAAYKHKTRCCIYQEAKQCMLLNKDTPERIAKFVDFLKSEKYPKNFGLTENGILYRKHNNPDCIKLMDKWWEFVSTRTRRDQLSLPYLCWKTNIQPYVFKQSFSYDELNFTINKHS